MSKREEIRIVRLKMEVDRTHEMYKTVGSSGDAARILTDLIGDCDRENFVLMGLNAKGCITHINIVSVGDVSSSVVHPREVFKAAYLSNSSGIIVGHNHPSGVCTPSAEDGMTTERLVKAGSLLGVPVVDHLIVTDDPDNYYSFKAHGKIMEYETSFNPQNITMDELIEPQKETEGRSTSGVARETEKTKER